MADNTKNVGAENAKVPDSAIQGTKAGERNRAATDAGVMPPDTGEARKPGLDPRDETITRKDA